MEKKRLVIYPGSFDPFTIGHLNILEKAEAIFGQENVWIAIGINPKKIGNYEILEQDFEEFLKETKESKKKTIKTQLPSKNVTGYIGFLTDYVFEKEKEGFDVVVIRGLRNGYDLDYEYNQTRFMWDMKPDLKIVYIPCDPIFAHVSSTAYRELEKVKPGSGHQYLAKI